MVPSLPSRDWHSGQSEKKHNQGDDPAHTQDLESATLLYCRKRHPKSLNVMDVIISQGRFWSCVIANPVFPVFLLFCVAKARFPRDGVSVPRCTTPGNNKEHLYLKVVTSAGSNFLNSLHHFLTCQSVLSYDLKGGNVPCKSSQPTIHNTALSLLLGEELGGGRCCLAMQPGLDLYLDSLR